MQTRLLIRDLQDQSREYLNFRVRIFEESIRNETIQDLNFFFNEVIQQADYPIVYTDAEFVPQYWRNLNAAENADTNIVKDSLDYLALLVQKFKQINPPIPISYDGNILGYYVYGESPLINQLRTVEADIVRQLQWLLIIEVLVVGMFIFIGYAGFNSIKKSEERFIWVGMAKETAHQLGTPLSSLLGWVEYIKTSPKKLEKVVPEFEKDLNRLQTITNRFSQIGSIPDLKAENIAVIIRDTVQYFQNRLPKKNGKIQIEARIPDTERLVSINKDLFSWVLENLIKNALDALETKNGKITVQQGEMNNSKIYIDIKDNGKGINKQNKKNIFKPGFSTKKRGWGLGLSLAKRIVEDYHGGKLVLIESDVEVGSTFRIILNAQ